MSIYKSAVKRPITTLMIFMAIIVMGIYSVVHLPVDLYPEIEFPAITVMTTYPGASASDIETNVSKVIEDGMNSVDRLKDISSVSYENLSVVTLEFQYETNLDEASNNIRDALDLIEKQLPDGCEKPVIFKFNSSMMPVLFYAVNAKESYPGLEKILDEKIINPLNRVDGIGSVGLAGQPNRVIYVNVDPSRLDAYHMTIGQIGNVIRAENQNTPSGNVKMGKMDYQLRVEGEFTDSRQLNNIIVGTSDGHPVYLRDVATVKDTLKDTGLHERINGQRGLRMFVMKQSGANTVKVAREVKKHLAELEKTLPPDVKIETIFDSSDFIKDSVSNLSQTLMFALLFVVLVVLAFLGRWRATFIVALTIPISLIVAFIYLYISGNSINVISLSSLSIAIGMVVDDAIVVLENISTHIERKSSPREASIYATNEVWLSVIVTTLVIVAVFFPLTLVSGMTGVMFRQLGWIVTITVVTSTVAAITLTPMLSSKLLKLQPKKEKPSRFSYDNTFLRALNALDRGYEKAIKWSLHHKKVILLGALAIFLSSMYLAKNLGTDFMPQTDESRIQLKIELQSGTRVEVTDKVAREVEGIVHQKAPEVKLISTSTGSDDSGGFISMFSQTGSNIINMMMALDKPSQRHRSVWEVAAALRKQLDEIPEVENYSFTFTSGMEASNTVDVYIYGYDFNTTSHLANVIASGIKEIKGASDVQISRDKEKPELKVVLDRDKLALHGLSTASVSAMIRNRVEGLTATEYREQGDEYDVIVRYSPKYRSSITDLENISIMTPAGKYIKLKEIGKVEEYWSPPNIEHRQRERVVKVSVTPYKTSLGQLAGQIQQKIDKLDVPTGVMIDVGGAYEDQQESFTDLGLLLLLSLVLVFLVMASQFESFKMPFIIMFSIPFSFAGVVLALLITGTDLNLVAALGAVLLVGIVVKNAIVLVDYTNLMRDRDMELYDAIRVAGKSRLRPVLMTALTTILGMLPMAISGGEGAEIWRPMGISVIGGLVFSTFITMIIVPVLYAVVSKKGERDKKTALRKKFIFMDKK
ncbi:efflux RND transporter permease subunit [Prolixibacter denitrificans]|uniref:HAE1 family hydrophobic/amphiphilic exporter-1 n=1 Tax=Prolixibacter denitrificans TaxID=1541063 RepID=A0A2P8CF71_9BACT|nr:efflux RND transporter permease subunit [Prolixibacter denitrificans]PSK83618.1 HAE1 family hydrophobic/amphiphilic exporter-1 [Prolixibacter denitrificans]GET23167.1 multidrug transporter AcrB [Prolixibacter denitrificans]